MTPQSRRPARTAKGPCKGAPPRVSADQARWYRLRRSGLGPQPFASPEEAAQALFGVQAQVNSAARLALWNRLAGPDPAQIRAVIEAAIGQRRLLVRSWGQRGTLHLYAVDDWPVACAAMAAREIDRAEQRVRRLEAKDRSRTMAGYESACRLARAILERPPDHRVSKSDLETEGGEPEAQAHYVAFLRLCLEGNACRIDAGDGGPATIGWRPALLPGLAWQPPPFERAMAEVARRFFSTYGPAKEADFRYWLSSSAADSRAAVRTLADRGELVEVVVDHGDGPDVQLVMRADLPALTERPPPPGRWPVRLLGRFDPLLLAHSDKSCWVDAEHRRRVWHHTHIEAVLLVTGRIRGIWRTRRAARGLTIDLQLFADADLPAYARRRVQKQAEAIAAFSGLPLVDVDSTVVG